MCFYTGEIALGLLNAFRIQPIKTLQAEVLQSISCLLNTKQSFGAWQKELGLEDYSYAAKSAEILQKMAEDIAKTIQANEKRFKLQSVTVSYFHNASHFAFELLGELERKPQIFYIHITKNHGINVTAEP